MDRLTGAGREILLEFEPIQGFFSRGKHKPADRAGTGWRENLSRWPEEHLLDEVHCKRAQRAGKIVASGEKSNQGLELELLAGAPVRAPPAKDTTGFGSRGNVDSKNGGRARRFGDQERSHLLDGELTVRHKLDFHVDEDLVARHIAELEREVRLDMSHEPAELT